MTASVRLLKTDEISRMLGVPKSWIYDRTSPTHSERIPHLKLGKYIRFDPESEEFKRWLQKLQRN